MRGSAAGTRQPAAQLGTGPRRAARTPPDPPPHPSPSIVQRPHRHRQAGHSHVVATIQQSGPAGSNVQATQPGEEVWQ